MIEFTNMLRLPVITAVAITVTAAALYAIKRQKIIYRKVGKTVKLFLYPIKSLPGVEVDNLEITKTGVKYGKFRDRSFLLINDEGKFITLRTEPSLALLKVELISESGIKVTTPNQESITVTLKDEVKKGDVIVKTRVWNQDTEGIDHGEEAACFFSKFLNKPVKLIQFVQGMTLRQSRQFYNNIQTFAKKYPIMYQDAGALYISNTKSIMDLNDRLADNEKVSYRNFRPNILIETGTAYEEDNFKFLQINNVNFAYLKPCDRCVLTTVNPDTGILNPTKEPLETLRTYRLSSPEARKQFGLSPLFGIIIGPLNSGVVKNDEEILASN